MIVDVDNGTMQMEPRDWKYIMRAYLMQFVSIARTTPDKIIFPMFMKVEKIPVEYVPELSEIAVTIISDGSNIPEVTAKEEEELNQKDEIMKEVRQAIKPVDRLPKQPASPISPTEGVHVDGVTGSRALDLRQVAADLREKEIDENKQKPISISRDSEGKRIIK